MNQKHFILSTLLAIIFWRIAHASNQESIKDAAIPNLATTTGPTTYSTEVGNAPLLDRSKTANSVVQDWNSVCKQLCGAGIGGPICDPQCDTLKQAPEQNQTAKANALLKDKKGFICHDLCLFNLGGSICKCQQQNSVNPKINPNRNMICTTFCEHNELTLAGCSICQRIENFAITTIKTKPTTIKPPSTTPNWDQVCVALCKTGDGGALCNCDLPPFL